MILYGVVCDWRLCQQLWAISGVKIPPRKTVVYIIKGKVYKCNTFKCESSENGKLTNK